MKALRVIAILTGVIIIILCIGYAAILDAGKHFVNPSGRLVELDDTVDVASFLERCDSLAKVSRLYPEPSYWRDRNIQHLSPHRVVYLDCDTNAIAVVDFVAGFPMIYSLDNPRTGRSLTGRSKVSAADKELIKQKLIRFVKAVKNGDPCP